MYGIKSIRVKVRSLRDVAIGKMKEYNELDCGKVDLKENSNV